MKVAQTNVLHVVHSRDCRFGIFLLVISDESETTASTSVAVLDYNLMMAIRYGPYDVWSMNYRFLNLTELLKLRPKRAVIGVPGKAADISKHDGRLNEHAWIWQGPWVQLTQ